MKRTFFICILASAILFAPSAEAVPVTFNYSGTFLSEDFPTIDFSGATISGSYTFDSATSDGNSSSNIGLYTDTLTNLSGTVAYSGGTLFFEYGATNGGTITVWNNNPSGSNFRDYYEVRAGGGDGVFDNLSGYTMLAFNLTMLTSSNPAPGFITSDALPLVPPELFGNRSISLTFYPDGSPTAKNSLQFQVTSLTAVPEPSTLILLGGRAGWTWRH